MSLSQGQSDWTFFKEERFTPILAQSIRISKAAAVAAYAYYHIDLNAGSGYNDDVGVAGSPVNFLRAIERNQRSNFYAFFVDKDLTCVRTLIGRNDIEALAHRVAIFHADNSEILPVVSAFIAAREARPQYAMGSLLIDPNGYHNGVPWDALRTFCARHRRIDVLMNLNVRQFRLERSHIQANRGDKWTREYVLRPVSTFPTWFSRPNWMITRVCQIKGNSWVQLVGRTITTDRSDYRSLGFYDIRSERGRAILDELERSSEAAPEFPLLRDL